MAGCCGKKKKFDGQSERVVNSGVDHVCVPENLCADDDGEAFLGTLEQEVKKSECDKKSCGCRKKKA